ncbi:HutD family protein [soil metagenome]
MKVIRARDMKSMPWKNGQGVTTEIEISPAGATLEKDDFLWRISRAEIRSDGPFSKFPHCDRWLTVLGPDDLKLNGVRQSPLIPFLFSGDDEVFAALDGTARITSDIGLIFRRGLVRCEMTVVTVSDVAPYQLDIPCDAMDVVVSLVSDSVADVAGVELSFLDTVRFGSDELDSQIFVSPLQGAAMTVVVAAILGST